MVHHKSHIHTADLMKATSSAWWAPQNMKLYEMRRNLRLRMTSSQRNWSSIDRSLTRRWSGMKVVAALWQFNVRLGSYSSHKPPQPENNFEWNIFARCTHNNAKFRAKLKTCLHQHLCSCTESSPAHTEIKYHNNRPSVFYYYLSTIFARQCNLAGPKVPMLLLLVEVARATFILCGEPPTPPDVYTRPGPLYERVNRPTDVKNRTTCVNKEHAQHFSIKTALQFCRCQAVVPSQVLALFVYIYTRYKAVLPPQIAIPKIISPLVFQISLNGYQLLFITLSCESSSSCRLHLLWWKIIMIVVVSWLS